MEHTVAPRYGANENSRENSGHFEGKERRLNEGSGGGRYTIRTNLRILLDFRRQECYVSAITFFGP